MKIRVDDLVVVIAGNEKSSEPRRVTAVSEGGTRITIEGVNKKWKHVKRGHPRSPQGGRLHVESPIDSSNVMVYCGSCNRPVRVGYAYTEDGAKVRKCKQCDAVMNQISPAKKRYAT